MRAQESPPTIFINKPQALKKLAERLARHNIIAVDTESNSLYAYREQVCLIQFSTTEEDYLVDPLALEDLTPLEPLFSNPEIEKVFHAAEYDLLCLTRDFGFHFANLFDTMVAASILGRPEVGLGSMLENEFGVELDKRFQRADWGQRPLPSALLSYARYDTHYLIPLRDRLAVDLQDAGRMEIAREDFHRLTHIGERTINPTTENSWFVTDTCLKISGSYELDPQQAAVLLELCRYRDRVAKSINRPLFKVISDATLLSIARFLPRTPQDLRNLPGMTEGQIRRHGSGILESVKLGLKSPPYVMTRSPKPDEAYLSRIDELRKWRKETALRMMVKSDVVLPKDLMIALAEQNPRSSEELERILQDSPWRLANYGEQILQILIGAKGKRGKR
jgi:ribonuclease D